MAYFLIEYINNQPSLIHSLYAIVEINICFLALNAVKNNNTKHVALNDNPSIYKRDFYLLRLARTQSLRQLFVIYV